MDQGLKFTKREWLTLFAIGSVNFSSAICVSLQAPFYPHEAELKGATATEYGLVFGIFELVFFIFSPIVGKQLDRIGVKYVLNTGIVVTAVSSIGFGLLDRVYTRTWFVVLSFLVRIIEALGTVAAVTAVFCITAAVFPESLATTIAALEVFYGVGFAVGPTIGGYLFQVGGFTCPFVVVGVFLLFDGLFIYLILPPIEKTSSRDQGGVLKIWRLPSVILDSCSVCVAALSLGYYSALLEPHIRVLDLTPVQTGSLFIVNGACYAITAPLVGRLCDAQANPKKIIIIGIFLVLVSFLLVGPAPFIPVDVNLWLCVAGLVLNGLGNAAIYVPAFTDIIRSSVERGFPDDISTYGIVSGIWASSFGLGAFVGPTVAGALHDLVGFRKGSLFPIALLSLLIISMTSYVCIERRPPRKIENSENLPLNSSSQNNSSIESIPEVYHNDSRLKDNNYGATTSSSTDLR